MTSQQKKILDYIPLAILIICEMVLLWKIDVLNIRLDQKHNLGMAFLGITTLLFFVRHNFGVFALGVILLLGLIGVYSFDPSVKTTTYYAGEYGQGYTTVVFILNPIFILWIVLHVILSWKSYLEFFSKAKTIES
jgi:hypothetical protein